jgi:hypothetical protein
MNTDSTSFRNDQDIWKIQLIFDIAATAAQKLAGV